MTSPEFPTSPRRKNRRPVWTALGTALGLAAMTGALRGQIVLSGPYEWNLVLPDNDPSGGVDVRTLAAPGYITGLTVDVSIGGPGSRNGDVYLSLSHESGFVVLLNRVGRNPGLAGGYADPGMTVTFSEGGEDIHTYRTSLFGNESTPLGDRLTGTWGPSGRDADPASVTASTPITAAFGSFAGMPVAGDWILYAADLGSGGLVTVERWSLTVYTSPTPVPEPAQWGFIGTLLAGLGALLRKRR